MKFKYILFGCLALLLVTTFFFKIIPIPVENQDGAKNPDQYIYGGIYWTSGLYQLSVYNFVGTCAYCLFFVTLFGGVHLLKWGGVESGMESI